MNHGMVENYIRSTGEAYFASRREKLGAMATPGNVAARQDEVRAICRKILGPLPEPVPLNIKTVGQLSRDGYTVELLTFESQPGVIVTANLYRPKESSSAPGPGVVCLSGHWPEGKAYAEYQRLGQLLARTKITALLFDQAGQGERLEFYDVTLRRSWIGKQVALEHNHLGNLLLLTGHHLGNWMLWDSMRAIDVLVEHGNVDPTRVGLDSFAASNAVGRFLACLEPRIGAAVIPADTIDPELPDVVGADDAEQELPDSVKMGLAPLDLLMPFVPHPLLLVCSPLDKSGQRLEANVAELTHWYSILGEKANLSVFKAERSLDSLKLHRARSVNHFAHTFGLGEQRLREPETPPETAHTLGCTETGQVGNSLNATSFFSLHKSRARELPPALPVPVTRDGARQLQEEIRARFTPYLRLPESDLVKNEIESRSRDWQFTAEKGRLIFGEREDLYVPYSFYSLPASGDSPTEQRTARTVVALHERGIVGISNQEALMQAFATAGMNVIAIDVPGIGETRLQTRRDDGEDYEGLLSGAEAQWARRALNVGLSIFGLRVYSVLRTLAYVRTRWDVKPDSLSLVGVGRGALWALYAAALDRNVSALATVRGLHTYKCLLQHRRHNHHFSTYLPGCLREFDLPQVAACVAPCRMAMINAVDQRKERCELDTVQREYALATALYKLFGSQEKFKMIHGDSAPETIRAVLDCISGE